MGDWGLDQDAVLELLCRSHVADRLNEGWHHGDFEKFRDALKEYIQSSLYAVTGKEVGTKLKVGAALEQETLI